jgi:hypothetical protein
MTALRNSEEQETREGSPTQEEAIPTLEEYEAALAALESMKDGGELHAFAAHMHRALSYEAAHGIRPTT